MQKNTQKKQEPALFKKPNYGARFNDMVSVRLLKPSIEIEREEIASIGQVVNNENKSCSLSRKYNSSRIISKSKSSGFSIVEVLVVVSIIAVLAAIAVPSFSPMMERMRVRQAVEEMQSTLFLARSEAIKRGGNVSIKAKSGSDWSSGWDIVYTSGSDSEVLQSIDAPLRTTVSLASSNGTLNLDRWGLMGASQLIFRVSPDGKDSTHENSSALCVGAGGRVKRISGASTDCS